MSERSFRIRVLADEIVVSLPGSYYSVTYYKPQTSTQLLAKHAPDVDDALIPVSVSEFLIHSAKLAYERARELGWIV